FVRPDTLQATGTSNYLHLRRDSLRFVDDAPLLARLRRSPVIRRRSGVEKFEVDLRRMDYPLARTAPVIAGVVFVSGKPAKRDGLLAPVGAAQALRRLAASQPYASGLPAWRRLSASLAGVAAFELRRAAHPAEQALSLRRLLEWGRHGR